MATLSMDLTETAPPVKNGTGWAASDAVALPCEVQADFERGTVCLAFGGIGGATMEMDAEAAWRLSLRIRAKCLALRNGGV